MFINERGAGRLNDTYASHSCKIHSSHVGHVSNGSTTVFINGRPAARIGDSISCGGSVAEGSPDVFIGG